jgi:hypothetical protein
MNDVILACVQIWAVVTMTGTLLLFLHWAVSE